MRKAISALSVFLIAVLVWGQQPPAPASAENGAAAVLSVPALEKHATPVPCSEDKGCSSSAMFSVNALIDGAFAQSAASSGAAPASSPSGVKVAPAPSAVPQEVQQNAKTANTPETLPETPVSVTTPSADAHPLKNAVPRENVPVSAAPKEQLQPAPKKFDPNEFRPDVRWEESHSTHFDIYTQKMRGVIGSANLAMTFETAYQTLRRFIPWMMSGRVRVFVYQNEESYLKNEPEAKEWTRALAYPFRGEIAVYDVPGKTDELRAVFTHELTHIFTQQFFDKSEFPSIQPPLWMDEGLAVLVEDQSYSGSHGGPWNHDYLTHRFVRARKKQTGMFYTEPRFRRTPRRPPTYSDFGRGQGENFPPRSRSERRPIKLMSFDDFMQDSSLDSAESSKDTQNWYLQAYLMVRFLLNPSGGNSPSNRMQFEQFTRLMAKGEAQRNPSTGYLVKDANGKQVYKKYDTMQALKRTYWYGSMDQFEDAFFQWVNK